jgi:hypothetical protein
MNTSELIHLLEEQARPLIESHYGELRTNLGTSHYHRLSNEELFRRGQAVLQNLKGWLSAHDAGVIHRSGVDLGRRRFSEGIPLGQVVLAVILEEKQLWEYTRQLQLSVDEKVRLDVAEFFARYVYSTALGYEEALAENIRHTRRPVVPPKAATPPAAPSPSADRSDMSTSRSGQVGEFGG